MKSRTVLHPGASSGSAVWMSAIRTPASPAAAGLLLGAGRGQQEPPDQHQPQAAEAAPGQQLEDAKSSDGRAEELPGPGRGGFGAAAVPVVLPQQGPQHPAAVQRRARQQVEGREQPVHDGKPLRGRDGHRRRAHRAERRSRAQEDTGRQCARRGPGQRDPQIGAGVGRLALQFSDPAQHPQGDRPHAHPVSAGHHRGAVSWASSEARKSTAPATAADQYSPRDWCGNAPGRTLTPSSQAISTRMTPTVQFAPTATPATRPSRMSCLTGASTCSLRLLPATLHWPAAVAKRRDSPLRGTLAARQEHPPAGPVSAGSPGRRLGRG